MVATLDRVHSLPSIAALEADPSAYATALAAELPAELEARDAALAGALRHVDDTATRVMRILLDHALAGDTSIAAPTRKVFASTVTGYAGNVALLEERVRDLAARGRAADPEAVARAAGDAARRTLALRAAVRDHVLALIREHATAAIPDADRRARDRELDERARKRWSAVRRDLEAIAEEPERVLAAPWAARVAAWPEQLDEPAPKPEPTLAELIELD
jgi:hypothetical protein